MTDFIELAKEGVKTVVPFLAIGGKEIIKSVASDLWKLIKSIAQGKDEEKLIEEFESSPNDSELALRVIELLESKIRHDEELIANLTQTIKTTQETEEYKSYISQVGDNNIAVTGKIQNSTININK